MDPRIAMITMCKEHIADKVVVNIAKWIVSDQAAHFYKSPFSNFSGKYDKDRWSNPGGLVEATLHGYRVLRVLSETSNVIHTTHSVNRVVAVYLLVMISRCLDVKNNVITTENASGSISTVAVSNALHFGMTDMDLGEIQALTKWWASRKDMFASHEPFNPTWWIVSQTLDWLFVSSRIK